MSTAPKIEEFNEELEQLFSISQALLNCESTDIEKMQQLIDQREAPLDWLQNVDRSNLTGEDKDNLQKRVAHLQALDVQVEEHLMHILNEQSKALRQIMKTRQVLSSYRFPYVPGGPAGIENRG